MAMRHQLPQPPDEAGAAQAADGGYGKIARFFLAMLAAFLIALGVKSFVAAPFSIPSESMEPSMLVGDYIIATKWDYGLGGGTKRLGAALPERGDVVIFDAGPQRRHYVKRVIGLPGDRVELERGRVILNGQPLARHALSAFMLPVTPQMQEVAQDSALRSPCLDPAFERVSRNGERQCRFRSFAETLPNGTRYRILDLADGLEGDDMPEIRVPEGKLFVMGDNRDRSLDSRLPAAVPGAIGLVPADRLIGRAAFVIFSVDGSAQIGEPQGWLDAVRWSRIGRSLR